MVKPEAINSVVCETRHLSGVIRFLSFVAVAGFLFFFAGCANQLPPGGGDIDTIPPTITEVYPQNGTLNFTEKYIEFSFSEYVDKRTFKDALFISPAIDGEVVNDWSGKSVRIYFPDKLKANTTYHVTVGTDVVDYNNKNRMAKSYSYVYSTGAKIDYGMIEGTVYAEKPSGVMIFGYQVNRDTIDPAKSKPDYISQVGTDGTFQLSGLAESTYRVFAVKDEFKDLLFQSEQDLIGVPVSDVKLTAKDTIFSNINFSLQKIDTLKPRLLSAVMTDKVHILSTYSEELQYGKLLPSNFFLIDSTKRKTIPVTRVFKGRGKEKEFTVCIDQALADSDKFYFCAKDFYDEAGNRNDSEVVSMMTNDKPDTTAPKLIKVEPPQSSQDINFISPSFTFGFDDAIQFDSLKSGVWLADTSRNLIPIKLEKIDDASFKIIPVQKLKSESNYRVVINFRKLPDYAGNTLDSIFQCSYKTMNELDFTGVYGDLTNYDSTMNTVLQLILENAKVPSYTTTPQKNGKFSFEKIKPGKYRLLCFNDANRNGIPDKGFPYPYIPAESFVYLKDVLNIPARWAITEVKFDVKALR